LSRDGSRDYQVTTSNIEQWREALAHVVTGPAQTIAQAVHCARGRCRSRSDPTVSAAHVIGE
jgi:hypothetical protein